MKNKKILQDSSKAERLEIMRASAESSEEFTYPKQLGGEELRQVKDDIVKGNIQMAKLKEEKDLFNAGWKERKKPVADELSENLQIARTHVEEVTETVYLMADQDEGVMEYYNDAGVCVFTRPLMPEEKQFRIVDNSKDGTNK